jgi:hypothetical protein
MLAYWLGPINAPIFNTLKKGYVYSFCMTLIHLFWKRSFIFVFFYLLLHFWSLQTCSVLYCLNWDTITGGGVLLCNLARPIISTGVMLFLDNHRDLQVLLYANCMAFCLQAIPPLFISYAECVGSVGWPKPSASVSRKVRWYW